MSRLRSGALKALAVAAVFSAALIVSAPQAMAKGGGGGGGHGGGGHGGGHGGHGGGHGGGHYGGRGGSYHPTYHRGTYYNGGTSLGGLYYNNYGYGYGYGSGYYGSSYYYPSTYYSSGYTTTTPTSGSYLTTQTYEPGDGYRYPLYYNPATGTYFYYPVTK